METPRIAADAGVDAIASALGEGDPHIVLEDEANPGARVFRAAANRLRGRRSRGV